MATVTFISAQDQYASDALNGNYNPNLPSAKFNGCYQEQMASPHSTQYTEGEFSDIATEIKRTNSNTSHFYEEISTFETIETAQNSKAKASEMQEEQLGSPQSTQAPSRKESDDTSSVNEEVDEEEEGDEIPELKDWNEKKEKM